VDPLLEEQILTPISLIYKAGANKKETKIKQMKVTFSAWQCVYK
jgi:hypothetical protein